MNSENIKLPFPQEETVARMESVVRILRARVAEEDEIKVSFYVRSTPDDEPFYVSIGLYAYGFGATPGEASSKASSMYKAPEDRKLFRIKELKAEAATLGLTVTESRATR